MEGRLRAPRPIKLPVSRQACMYGFFFMLGAAWETAFIKIGIYDRMVATTALQNSEVEKNVNLLQGGK